MALLARSTIGFSPSRIFFCWLTLLLQGSAMSHSRCEAALLSWGTFQENPAAKCGLMPFFFGAHTTRCHDIRALNIRFCIVRLLLCTPPVVCWLLDLCWPVVQSDFRSPGEFFFVVWLSCSRAPQCRPSGCGYLDDATRRDNFIKALYQNTLSKHFVQAFYQSTLSKHFIQALYQQSGRVVLKLFKNYPAKVLQMY